MTYTKKPGAYARKSFGSRPSFKTSRDAYGEQQRYQAVCSECQKACEVPFRPNGKKPVYCRDCFKGKEESPSYGSRSPYKAHASHGSGIDERLSAIEQKLDRILKSLGK